MCCGFAGRIQLNRFSISHSDRYKASRLASPAAFFIIFNCLTGFRQVNILVAGFLYIAYNSYRAAHLG